MSKSHGGESGTLFLDDDADAISKKIRRAVTDSEEGISYNPDLRCGFVFLLSFFLLMRYSIRPALANLIRLYCSVVDDVTPEDCEKQFASSGKLAFKEALADAVSVCLLFFFFFEGCSLIFFL